MKHFDTDDERLAEALRLVMLARKRNSEALDILCGGTVNGDARPFLAAGEALSKASMEIQEKQWARKRKEMQRGEATH